MNSKKIVGIVLVAIIVGLMVMMLSQDTSKKPTTETKVEDKQVAQTQPKSTEVSEEEQKLQDLKKQAGANLSQEVSKFYTVRCSSCHGKAGEGTMVGPQIAGKSFDYIINKLDDYKNNRVPNSLMQGLLTNISQEDAKTLAKEISNFK